MHAADTEAPWTECILFVESGIHGDIRIVPSASVTTVGRSVSSDLVLGDLSVAGTHFRLHVGKTVTLEAVEQAVLLASSECILPGQTRLLACTTAFKAGNVSMRLDIASQPPVTAGPPPLWHRIAAALVLLAFAGSAALAFASRGSVRAPAAGPSLPTPRLEAASGSNLAAPDLAGLRAQLEQRHLGPVQVEALPDGSYRASGILIPQDAAAWREMMRWVDEAGAGRVVLIDKVGFANLAPPLAIQSAWVGERPYVIDGGGEKLFVGAVLANGWTVEGIEPGRVLMERRGQHLAVKF